MLDKSNLIPIWICWKSDLGCQSKWNPSASFYLFFSSLPFFFLKSLSPLCISVCSLSHSLSHQTPSVPKRMTQWCELDHKSSHHNTPATLQTHYATPWTSCCSSPQRSPLLNLPSITETVPSYGNKFHHSASMAVLSSADSSSYTSPVCPVLSPTASQCLSSCSPRLQMYAFLFVYLFFPLYVHRLSCSLCHRRSFLLALYTIIFLFCMSLAELAHAVSGLLSDAFPSIWKASQ